MLSALTEAVRVKPGSQFLNRIDLQGHTVGCIKFELCSILECQFRLLKEHSQTFILKKNYVHSEHMSQ